MSLFKQSASRTKGLVQKTAVIGLTGVQKILVSAVSRFSGETLHLFLDPADAENWLAGDATSDGEVIAPIR